MMNGTIYGDDYKDGMNFLELVEFYMDVEGYDEELACRIASQELYPERYNADDYDN